MGAILLGAVDLARRLITNRRPGPGPAGEFANKNVYKKAELSYLRYANAQGAGKPCAVVRTVSKYGDVKMRRSVELACDRIRDLVRGGYFPPGERIRQEELVELCGVSRTPIRDALRVLEKEGLIELRSNNGAYVSNWSEDDLSLIFELRADLESIAARRAASKISERQLAEMSALASEMEALVDASHKSNEHRIREANREFHRIILEAAGSRTLFGMVAMVLEAPHALRSLRRYTREDIDRSMQHHREIIEALRGGDARLAASVMRLHVDQSYRPMVRGLEEAEGRGLPSSIVGLDRSREFA